MIHGKELSGHCTIGRHYGVQGPNRQITVGWARDQLMPGTAGGGAARQAPGPYLAAQAPLEGHISANTGAVATALLLGGGDRELQQLEPAPPLVHGSNARDGTKGRGPLRIHQSNWTASIRPIHVGCRSGQSGCWQRSRGVVTPESRSSQGACHPAARPIRARPVAPAAELSECAGWRRDGAFFPSLLSLSACFARQPRHFHRLVNPAAACIEM
ncbi:hypothetical protein J3F83DRAFT_644620 [Trichoderma novae-zelandiae]